MKVIMKNNWWSAVYVNGVPRMACQTARAERSKGTQINITPAPHVPGIEKEI